MPNHTFSKILKELQPSHYSLGEIGTPRLHHLSKKTYANFDIFKKALDISKDVIRSHIHLIQKLDRFFPLLGLLIGLVGLSLQLLIIIFDKQHSKNTKIAAGIIFTALIGIACAAFALAVNFPILSGALGIAISFVTFLSDGYQFRLGLKKLFKLKKRREKIYEKAYREEKLQRLQELSKSQEELFNQLKRDLKALLDASGKKDNQQNYSKALEQTRKTLVSLVDTDTEIRDIRTEPEALSKLIHQQSKTLTISAVSLTINVVSISLAITCLATCGMVPWGLSILLAMVFIVDLIEFGKNIHSKRTYDNEKRKERADIDKRATDYIMTTQKEITLEESSSYQKMVKAMPKEKLQNKPPSPTYHHKLWHTDENIIHVDLGSRQSKDMPTKHQDALQSSRV